MLHDLTLRNIEGWAPRDNVPATNALSQQKIQSMDDVERWWYAKLMDGILPNAKNDWHESKVIVIKSQLRADYAEYAKDQGVYRKADEVQFGMRLGKLIRLENTQTKPADTDYGVKTDRLGRASAYSIPPLADCRQRMEEKLGTRVDWPHDALD